MVIYGEVTVKEDQYISNRILNVGDEDKVESFKYTKLFYNRFDLIHIVGDKSNLSHSRTSLEET